MTNQIDKLIDELPSWRDIESAPDDVVIYGYDKGTGNNGCVRASTDGWELVNMHGTGLRVGFFPTHWLPLPTEDTIMVTREELRDFVDKVREVEMFPVPEEPTLEEFREETLDRCSVLVTPKEYMKAIDDRDYIHPQSKRALGSVAYNLLATKILDDHEKKIMSNKEPTNEQAESL